MIYKLVFKDKKEALESLISNNIIDQDNNYLEGTIAVVYVGELIESYDEENNPIYREGYHIDIMTEQEKDFENAVYPNSPKHMFAGCENTYFNSIPDTTEEL